MTTYEPGEHSSEKAGLPPGEMRFIGRKDAAGPRVTIIDYDAGHLESKEISSVTKAAAYKDKPTVTWINVEGMGDLPTLRKLGEAYDLHPLTMEDIANTHQRPKCEDYGHYLFVVLRMLRYEDTRSGRIVATQVGLVMGKGFVISFQEGGGDVFDPVRARIKRSKGRIRSQGSDYLLYSLMDAVVDGYFKMLERIGERIEGLEGKLLDDPAPEVLISIQGMKRDLILLRRSIWPVRDVVSGVMREAGDLVAESTRFYLRDVQDHAMRVTDAVETNREALSGLLDIYLSTMSNRMNAVMKVLTIIATIFIPLSFFAGVYGMNFEHMPEYGWKHSYPVFWGVMVAIVLGMVVYFRRKRWL
ncbi:MAG: magnesium/cobalt transporter CorA [Planctomycetota bacterium]